MSKHTPAPWLRGKWTIYEKDRAAQARGEPYWTFEKSEYGNDYAHGPYGRKAMQPDRIVDGTGWEHDGPIFYNDKDEALFLAAPEMLEKLKKWVKSCVDCYPGPPSIDCEICGDTALLIAKAEGFK